MLAPMVPALCKKVHKVECQLKQLRAAVAELYESGGRGKTARGKAPAFVSLLSEELQNYDPVTPPLALARHLKEETDKQKAVRLQRDAVWEQVSPPSLSSSSSS